MPWSFQADWAQEHAQERPGQAEIEQVVAEGCQEWL